MGVTRFSEGVPAVGSLLKGYWGSGKGMAVLGPPKTGEPGRPVVAPTVAKVFSVNCQGGVLPTAGEKNREKDKFATICDWLNEAASFICLQDLGVGFHRNEPPGEVVNQLEGEGHSIVCAGGEGDPAGTVAIIVHKSWRVTRVHRVKCTSRCIGVEVMRGDSRLLIVSVYLKPGMGSSVEMQPVRQQSLAVTEKRQERLEAYRILREVRRWIRGYDGFVVCGDLTKSRPDRWGTDVGRNLRTQCL